MARRKRKPKSWVARCEGCGKRAPIFREPEGDELLTPCTRCGCETAVYEQA